MNDLNVINLRNAEAVKAAVPRFRSQGLFVVQEYAGLSFVDAHPFTTEAEANSFACELGLQPGKRASVLYPFKATDPGTEDTAA